MWRPDVEGLIRRLYRHLGKGVVHFNTYYDHPEGWAWDTASFDGWGPKGRNDPIAWDVGDEIVRFIMNDPNPPWVEWYIWRRRIHTRSEGFVGRAWGSNPFEYHNDHPHFSFSGNHRLLP